MRWEQTYLSNSNRACSSKAFWASFSAFFFAFRSIFALLPLLSSSSPSSPAKQSSTWEGLESGMGPDDGPLDDNCSYILALSLAEAPEWITRFITVNVTVDTKKDDCYIVVQLLTHLFYGPRMCCWYCPFHFGQDILQSQHSRLMLWGYRYTMM